MADNKPRINSPSDKKDPDAKIEAQVKRDLEEDAKKQKAEEAKAVKKADKSNAAEPVQLTPIQRAMAFASGTFSGFGNGVANGGRYGFYAALALVVIGGIGFGASAIPTLLVLGVPGLMLAGMALGATAGTLVGGAREVARKERGDDEDVVLQTPRQRPHSGMNYQERREAQQDRVEVNFDRLQQQQRVDRQDANTYWRDEVSNRSGGGWARGL